MVCVGAVRLCHTGFLQHLRTKISGIFQDLFRTKKSLLRVYLLHAKYHCRIQFSRFLYHMKTIFLNPNNKIVMEDFSWTFFIF